MDEDTVIAVGFAVGAAILVGIVFTWVVVYCLCCRERERAKMHRRQGPVQEQFRYVSTTYNQKMTEPVSMPVSHVTIQAECDMRYRQLPDIPKEQVQPSSRPRLETPDEQLAKANEGFIVSTDALYTYCDSFPDMPSYHAPDIPADKKSYNRVSSRESLFLEKKYNIKSDDADDIHNGRPLSEGKRIPSISSQTEYTDKQEEYDDVNYVKRQYSVLSECHSIPSECPMSQSVEHRSISSLSTDGGKNDMNRLNINQNAQAASRTPSSCEEISVSDFVDAKSSTDTTHADVDSVSCIAKKEEQENGGELPPVCSHSDGLLKDRSSSSVDTQSTLPVTNLCDSSESDTSSVQTSLESSPIASPSAYSNSKSFANTIYSHNSTVGTGHLREIEEIVFDISVKDITTEPASSQHAPATATTSAPITILTTSSQRNSVCVIERPTPKPRRTRSASLDNLLYTLSSDNSTMVGEYANIRPVPKPRSSLDRTPPCYDDIVDYGQK